MLLTERYFIAIAGWLILSCNDSPSRDVSENVRDSATVQSNLPLMSAPVIFSAGVADTIISFSVDGISAEGSEIKARYINDTIREAQWNIFGETGKTIIHYDFPGNGHIYALEKHYVYATTVMAINSPEDIIIKDSISYLLDKNGVTTNPGKEFTNIYSYFKENVPLVLKKN